jgi:TetR/AcrR family transcriptional regulator, transcriptional repressor for nem operon
LVGRDGAGFTAIYAHTKRKSRVDLPDLATAVLAALQGGLLLAQTTRSTRPLELALDMAIDHVAAYLR